MGDNHYRAVFFQAIVKRAGVPIMHGLALLLAACVGHAAERIIDQRDMCTAPHERATDTGREVAATGVGHPTAFSLAVLGQSRLENLRILGRGDQVAYVAAEIFGQGYARACRNKLFVWMAAEIPGRETARG